jgi:hypothetical protein
MFLISIRNIQGTVSISYCRPEMEPVWIFDDRTRHVGLPVWNPDRTHLSAGPKSGPDPLVYRSEIRTGSVGLPVWNPDRTHRSAGPKSGPDPLVYRSEIWNGRSPVPVPSLPQTAKPNRYLQRATTPSLYPIFSNIMNHFIEIFNREYTYKS